MSQRRSIAGFVYVGLMVLPCVMSVLGGLVADEPAKSVAPIPGIENLRQVSPRILCGGQPESPESFAELSRRGVKIVISVDGAPTNIEEAHQHGLRYVHVPIGYGKIGPQQRADLVQAVKSANGLVFVHCHHGKHRGPAAAGYCGLAIGELTKEQGVQLLNAAGTRKDYTGLWDAIEQFEPPRVPAGKLVEQAEVAPVVAAMVRIDHHWTGLETSLKGKTPPGEEVRQELLQLTEEFRELPRTSAVNDTDLKKRMLAAQAASEALLKAVESKAAGKEIQTAAAKMTEQCKDCHANHRQ